MSVINVSREAVYAKLWEMPMKEVIEFYDTDYHQLRTFCNRNKIPTPPLGYWNKAAAGKPLPKRPALEPMTYYQHALQTGFKKRAERGEAREGKAKEYARRFAKIKVPALLSRPHELVKRFTRGDYNSQHYNHENAKQYDPPFSPGTNRALRNLDTLLKALELEGYRFEEDKNWWIDGVSGPHRIHFRFREQYRQVKVTHPIRTSFATELERTLYRLTRRDTSVTLEPKGVVEFSSYSLGLWTDKEFLPLEAQLPKLLAAVLASRDAVVEEAKVGAHRAEERARLAAIKEAELQEKARDQASWNAFTAMADAWENKTKLQSFYFALRSLPTQGATIIGDRSIEEWKEWLEQKIAERDPLGAGAEEVFRKLEAARNGG
ncbi:hypothetical protein N8E89_09405 [Phyllobacterium sp. A18/5-2]|uniref:hypothetical protein n=1 Tax=Phyllobacterium sp. A18/5-2 TaxID=2978392 RepID=UPI0021C96282|nr:hypothetical protein [Phyllobacterium sp. A18/5-2]UXN62932.1 hypothetical protein N8E89_09405 [Phyllobacterium sp. A18/5-2]